LVAHIQNQSWTLLAETDIPITSTDYTIDIKDIKGNIISNVNAVCFVTGYETASGNGYEFSYITSPWSVLKDGYYKTHCIDTNNVLSPIKCYVSNSVSRLAINTSSVIIREIWVRYD
jgi:hypothetical protein